MAGIPTPNRPGQRPYSAAGTAPVPTPAKRKPQPPPLLDPNTDAYDPFGLLDKYGLNSTPNGTVRDEAAPPLAGTTTPTGVDGKPLPATAAPPRPNAPGASPQPAVINAHVTDTDPSGGLHTTGLTTSHLQTGNLSGGPQPASTTTNNAVYQGNGTVAAGGRSGRSGPPVIPTTTAAPAASSGSGSALSDGSTFVPIPQHDASGKQIGWQYVTPDQANWYSNFGHLPGTASHPITAAENGSNFPMSPGSYGKLSQTQPTHEVGAGETAFVNGQPVAPGNSVTFGPNGPRIAPTVPVTHHADGTSVASTPTPAPTPAIAQTPALPASNFPQAPTAYDPTKDASTFNPGTPAAPPLALNTGAPTPQAPSATGRVGFVPPTLPPAVPVRSESDFSTTYDPSAPTASIDNVRAMQPSPALANSRVAAMDRATSGTAAPSTPATTQQDAITRNSQLGSVPATPAAPRPAAVPMSEADAIARNSNLGQPKAPTVPTTPAAPTSSSTATVATAPLPGEPGATTASSSTSGSTDGFPKTPGNPFTAPKPLTLGSTAPTATTPPTIPTDDELKKLRLAQAGN